MRLKLTNGTAVAPSPAAAQPVKTNGVVEAETKFEPAVKAEGASDMDVDKKVEPTPSVPAPTPSPSPPPRASPQILPAAVDARTPFVLYSQLQSWLKKRRMALHEAVTCSISSLRKL